MRTSPPRWPTLVLGTFAVLATLSLLQGIVDIVVPAVTGAEPFGFLFAATEMFGPGFLVGYVFVHNLGLACLVPGYGFVAAYFERRTRNRALIGVLLAGAVVLSLLVAAHYILTAPGLFDLPTSLALLAAESIAVLALALAAARELHGFVPTRTYEWSLVTPLRKLRTPFAFSFTLLLLLSVFEAWTVLGL